MPLDPRRSNGIYQEKKEEFKKRVLGQISKEIEDLYSWWNETAEFLIRTGKEILGGTSGKIWKDKETWWFNAEVQRLYEDLDSKEGQGKVFQLAKTRNKSTKDIVHIKQMKDENGNLISTEQGNIKRWEQYFSKLLNEGNERLIRGDGDANQGAVLEISRIEVQQALKKMKNGKATRPDGIPIEAWKAMGEEGIVVLRMLRGKVMEEENIPTKIYWSLEKKFKTWKLYPWILWIFPDYSNFDVSECTRSCIFIIAYCAIKGER
ncbi:uncharacterized protein LOC134783218 [Penaeus indicus]|uniref:uncharacterized protein LOC134783218 n=1 Tax=Penaeus indicus TaxID=29960 RepID=UPI00300C08C3